MAKVSITILNPKTKLIERHDAAVRTGHQPGMVAARDAGQRLCREMTARYFAIPSFVTKGGTERWLVFRYTAATEMAVLERDWPTRDAAEMWMQHHAL